MNIDFDAIKNQVTIKDYAAAVLEPKGKSYICPKCGSGNGKNGTPAFSITADGQHCKCFSCDLEGDIFDLAGAVNNTTNKYEQAQAVAAWAGLNPSSYGLDEDKGAGSTSTASAKSAKTSAQTAEQAKNLAIYLESTRNLIKSNEGSKAMDYLRGRGFTDEEIARFGFGYDWSKDSVVIPWVNDTYYAGRFITEREDGRRYDNAPTKTVGKQPIFNPQALEHDKIILVEGLLDAYALMALGFDNVVSLATNKISDKCLDAFISAKYNGIVIIATDNDNEGEKGAETIKQRLEKAGILYVTGTAAPAGYKDAGEVFESGNRKMLEQHYMDLEANAITNALVEAGLVSPADIAGNIFLLSDAQEPIPTGFANIDRALDGGLSNELYVFGAASSMGKTSLVIQIADHIAANGRPVLFVSIEQSAQELVTKSLSRICREVAGEVSGKPNPNGTIAANSMISKQARAGWSTEKTNILLSACDRYSTTIAPNMRVYHPEFNRPGVAKVAKLARLMKRAYGVAPVIFIDYLQLLAQVSERDDDKRTTDKNMTLLRQLVTELKTPVFVISSVNRESYYMPIELESFKESGGIEFGADVVLGLQIRDFESLLVSKPNKDGETKPLYGEARKTKAKHVFERTKKADERKLEIRVLKNRNGAMPKTPIHLDFVGVSMQFSEPGKHHASDDAI